MLSRYEVEAVLCTRLFSCRINRDRISDIRTNTRSGDCLARGASVAGVAKVRKRVPGVGAGVLACGAT